MKYIALIGFFLSTLVSFSQNTTELLTRQIVKIEKTTTEKAWLELAKEFEKIAKDAPKDWYAQYYTSYAYIALANASEKDKDAWCDKAETYLNNAFAIEKASSENYVLKAYLLSARIQVNPMMRGASMGKASKKQLDLAQKANPDNPRYYYVRGMGIYNTPAIFGGGKKKAKPYLEKALVKYKEYKASSALSPDWGKTETKKLLSTY